MTKAESRAVLVALLAYTAASVLHFVHNAVFLASYPNMPGWISRVVVYGALAGVLTVGACGYALLRCGHRLLGLLVIAAYAALGFDGLAHYSLAPISAHSAAMNFTIWLEVAAAALLLALVVGLIARRLVPQKTEAGRPGEIH